MIVIDRKWLDESEYASLLGLCQALPGANTCNMAVVLGDRFFGASGAFAALAGLLTAPLCFLIVFVQLFYMLADFPETQAALTGAGAAAAGLAFGSALRMLRASGGDKRLWVLAALAFALVGFFRAPMAVVLAILIPLSLFCLREKRKT